MRLYRALNCSITEFQDRQMGYGNYGPGTYLSKDIEVAKYYLHPLFDTDLILEYYLKDDVKLFHLHEDCFVDPSQDYYELDTPIKGELAKLLGKDTVNLGADLRKLKNLFGGILIESLSGPQMDGGNQVLVFNYSDLKLIKIHYVFKTSSSLFGMPMESNNRFHLGNLKIALDFMDAEYSPPIEEGDFNLRVSIPAHHLEDFKSVVEFHNTRVKPIANSLEWKVDYMKRIVFHKSEAKFYQ